MTEWVQTYGRDTDIPLSSVLLFEAEDKMTVVTYLDKGAYRQTAVLGPLKKIIEQHGGYFIRLSRNCLAHMPDVKKLEHTREGWQATVVGWDSTPRVHHVSRRCKPMVAEYLKGRDAT